MSAPAGVAKVEGTSAPPVELDETAVDRKREAGKLRIAFDTGVLNQRYRNQGIYSYARNLLPRLGEKAAQHGAEIRPFVCAGAENDANQISSGQGLAPQSAGLLRSDRGWRLGGAWLTTLRSGADLVFCPNFTSLQFGLCKVVTTIHDATPLTMPFAASGVNRKLKFALKNAARFSSAIITVSRRSKEDLVHCLGMDPGKVHVVYNGFDRTRFNAAAEDPQVLGGLRRRLGMERPYILHHGAIHPRKNLKRLVQAYRLLQARDAHMNFDLVLAGPRGWMYQEVLDEIASGGGGKVILTGALRDRELAALVKGATLAVVPSLYEGFCLPMVEIMACGVPTIAADNSCLPEVSANTLLYFDPYSVEDMAEKMQSALFNPDLRAQLRTRGLARAAEFSWERCVQETLDVLLSEGAGAGCASCGP